jgi:hypothetical protein
MSGERGAGSGRGAARGGGENTPLRRVCSIVRKAGVRLSWPDVGVFARARRYIFAAFFLLDYATRLIRKGAALCAQACVQRPPLAFALLLFR